MSIAMTLTLAVTGAIVLALAALERSTDARRRIRVRDDSARSRPRGR